MIPSEDEERADLSECAQGKLAVKPKKGTGELAPAAKHKYCCSLQAFCWCNHEQFTGMLGPAAVAVNSTRTKPFVMLGALP
jgi:hypothetical protein